MTLHTKARRVKPCHSFWKKARRFPPFVVRMLARWNYSRVMTDAEVAMESEHSGPTSESGLSVQLVGVLSSATSWRGIDLPTMQRFLIGCHLDFENAQQMHRINQYLRRNPNWKHLKTSPEWNSRWVPLIQTWRTLYGTADTNTITTNSGIR